MPIDPTTVPLDDLRPSVHDGYKANYQMWDGDHWQEGAGWESVLPDPVNTSSEKYEAEKKRVEEAFTSKNVIREVVERHLDGVIGRPPSMAYTRPVGDDSDDEADPVDEVSDPMLSKGAVIDLLRKAGRHPLMGASGYLRVYPSMRAYTDDMELRTDLSYDRAVSALNVKACRPQHASVTTIDGERVAAYWRTYGGKEKVVEVSYLNGDRETVIAVIESTQDERGEEQRTVRTSTPMALGGRLHVVAIDRDRIVTEQVRQQQHTVNKAATMADTNLDYGGFMERIFLNAQRPVKRIENARGQDEFVDAPYQTGAGETAFIAGLVTEDSEGNETLATPKVKFREPVDPSTFEETKDMAYRDILGETNQRHVLMSGDSTASGLSRIAARKDFVSSLRPTKRALTQGGEWLATVVPMFADVLASASRMENVNVSVDLRLDRGMRTPEEIKILMGMVDNEQLSLMTALELIGLTDAQREIERISGQEVSTIDRKLQKAKILKQLVTAGASLQSAAEVAGFEPEEAQLLMQVPVPQTQQ
jgi:hypothetical protein